MITININNIEDVYYSKRLVEADLREKGELEEDEPFNLTDFISRLHLDKTIYITRNNEKVIPFSIVTLGKDKYIFSTEDNPTELYNVLKNIDYDFNKLTKKSNVDILQEDLINEPHFIINNDFYL